MAGTTGLEPATSAVTGQRSNQLSYVPSAFAMNFPQVAEFTGFSYCSYTRLLSAAIHRVQPQAMQTRNCHHSVIQIIAKISRMNSYV